MNTTTRNYPDRIRTLRQRIENLEEIDINRWSERNDRRDELVKKTESKIVNLRISQIENWDYDVDGDVCDLRAAIKDAGDDCPELDDLPVCNEDLTAEQVEILEANGSRPIWAWDGYRALTGLAADEVVEISELLETLQEEEDETA